MPKPKKKDETKSKAAANPRLASKKAADTRSKNALKALKKLYEGRFDDCSAAIFVVIPPDGRIVSVNTEAEELTAYEKSELEEMYLHDIFREEDRLRIASIFDSSANMQFRKLFEHNVIVRKRSKRKIFVDMGFKKTSLAGHDTIVFTLQDITDLKNNEERVIRANQYINSIINGITEILLVSDEQGKIQSLNTAALNLLGYLEHEVIGKPVRMLFPELVTDFNQFTIREFAEIETIVRTKDSVTIPVLLSGSILKRLRSDEGIRMVIVAMDISERKKSERLIAEQQTMIVQASKMSSLGEMASSIAHEINNPLHILLGRAEILSLITDQAGIDHPELASGLAHIERMGQRIQKIVRGLQALTRDQRQDPLERVDFSQILADTLSFCEQRIRIAITDFEVPTLIEPTYIFCRPTQISQVLLNLLNNSYDAVMASKSDQPGVECKVWIKIEVTKREETLEIAVSDSGDRLPKSVIDKLFTPFFTTKPVGKGTGIGLSVSKSLIESHGGSLVYDDASPHTRFVVKIPTAKENIEDLTAAS
jgi:PAS domain S-box-containing protein